MRVSTNVIKVSEEIPLHAASSEGKALVATSMEQRQGQAVTKPATKPQIEKKRAIITEQ